MSWKEGLQHVIPPDFSPQEIRDANARLASNRDTARPVVYAESILAVAACEVDMDRVVARVGSAAVVYALAHRDSVLPILYDKGADEADKQMEMVRSATDATPFEVLPDPKDGTTIHGAILFARSAIQQQRNLRIARLTDLRSIHEASISPPMKRIACAEYIQTWISSNIKSTADNQVSRLRGLTSDTNEFFSHFYRGSEQQIGFARYAGCYETFSREIVSLYHGKYADKGSEAMSLLSCALFMSHQQSNPQWTVAKVREYKREAMYLLDAHNLDGARTYLQGLSLENPWVFNTISMHTLWGDTLPEVPEGSLLTEEKREAYRTVSLEGMVAGQYCREVLGLSKKEIDQRARACAGMVVGVLMHANPTKEVGYDIAHFEQYRTRTGAAMMDGAAYRVVRGDILHLKHNALPQMSNAFVVAMLDLGRFITLDRDVSPRDLTQAKQIELISKLDEERRAAARHKTEDG